MLDEATQRRIQTFCQMVLTAGVIAFSVYWLRPVLVPFVVAIFIVSGLAPLLLVLERRLKVSRLVAAGIAFLLGFIILFVLGAMLRASILDLAQYGPAYRERMQGIVQRVDNYFPPTSSAVQIPAGKIAGEAGQLRDTAHFADQLLRDGVAKLTQELIRLLSSSVVVLIYVFFLLLGASDVSAPNPTWREIEEKIRSYLSLKTVISVLTGIAFGLALWLFGVPMALTFGLLAFLLNYIPSIGPLIASLLPIPFIVLHPEPNFVWMAGVILVTSGIQVVSGNVVEPRIMGRSFDLHPVVVLLALMFWGMLWGVVGMFLATPITAGIKIVLERFDATRPAANIMAGRF